MKNVIRIFCSGRVALVLGAVIALSWQACSERGELSGLSRKKALNPHQLHVSSIQALWSQAYWMKRTALALEERNNVQAEYDAELERELDALDAQAQADEEHEDAARKAAQRWRNKRRAEENQMVHGLEP